MFDKLHLNIAVVISTWTGSPQENLYRLLSSMQHYDAGTDYSLHLCANGTSYRLPDHLAGRFTTVMVRENTGYNLGAWDYAWRKLSDHTYFLFLQDDCYVRKHNWVSDFITCFRSHKRCGLVGEHLNKGWDYPWSELIADEQDHRTKDRFDKKKKDRARYYLKTLKDWGYDPCKTARHITTVVQFTSIEVLKAVNGYDVADSYQEAIAAEIGFSKKIEAKGYQIRQIGRYGHSRIGHRQWSRKKLFPRLLRKLKRTLNISDRKP